MRRQLTIAATLSLGLALLHVGAISAQDNRPGIAVMTFEDGGSYGQDAEDFQALRVGMQQMLMTELGMNSAARVVDRAQINALLQEQDLGANGRVDQNTAARIGKVVGARYMIFGSFMDFYGDFRIDARIIDVETSELVKTTRVRDSREELYQLIVELGESIMADVNLPPLPEAVREARESRELPAEALTLYSRALFYQDRGQDDRAIELFRRVQTEFPEMTEATEALQQLGQP